MYNKTKATLEIENVIESKKWVTKCAVWIQYNVTWQEKRHSALDPLQAEENLWHKFALINIPEKRLCIFILMNVCLSQPSGLFFFPVFFIFFYISFLILLYSEYTSMASVEDLSWQLIGAGKQSALGLGCIRAPGEAPQIFWFPHIYAPGLCGSIFSGFPCTRHRSIPWGLQHSSLAMFLSQVMRDEEQELSPHRKSNNKPLLCFIPYLGIYFSLIEAELKSVCWK